MRYLWIGLAAGTLAWSGGWPSFRGENGSGIGDMAAFPERLAPDGDVIWKAPLPPGTSSAVGSGGRIFLTAYEPGKLLTLALDARSGRTLWRGEIDQPRQETLHKLNSPASSTPVTDGANVYVFFGDYGVVSYDGSGKERWRRPLGPFANLHGMAVSPVLAGNKLILVCDQDTGSYILALDRDTGRDVWKKERAAVVHGFATPTLFQPTGGAMQIVVPGSYLLVSYDAATGAELWSVRGLSWQIKNTGVVENGVIYVTGWAPGADPGQNRPLPPFEQVLAEIDANKDGKLAPDEINPSLYKHSGSWRAIDLNEDQFIDGREFDFYRARRAARNVTLAVRPGNARGDITDTHVVWSNDRNVPQVSSPLLYEGVLYTIKDGGILTSMDAATGKIHKTARVPGAIDPYYASPVAAAGRIVLASEHGKVSVIRPGADWDTAAVTDFGENIYATPAIIDGWMYLRTASTLYCFGKK